MGTHTIYAVGDVHGHRTILEDLLERIERDANGAPYQLVFLGDYIDRGPDSKGVIDRMVELRSMDWEHPPVFLMGNHEEKIVAILDGSYDQSTYDNFMKFGGEATFASYGVAVRGDVEDCAAALVWAVPPEHRAFLSDLRLSFQTSTHYICHAGVDFTKGLDAQDQRTLLWTREGFLETSARASKIIVHGHTITKDFLPEIRDHRIGIDTGAYKSGRLTALVIDGLAPARFVMTCP